MPYFTPDSEYFAVGRPYKLWWARIINYPYFLCFRSTKDTSPIKLYSPLQEELDEFPLVFDSGRETFVSYELVREMDLTKYGRVFYRDDYDDTVSDEWIAHLNRPFDRAEVPEPVWYPEKEQHVPDSD